MNAGTAKEEKITKRTRIEEIALLIEKNGKMSLEELSEQFPEVSDMTLRRDLLELEKENKVIRVRGGAMSVLEVQKRSNEAYAQKSTINTDAKKVIAKKAVSLVDEGVSMFLSGFGWRLAHQGESLHSFPLYEDLFGKFQLRTGDHFRFRILL